MRVLSLLSLLSVALVVLSGCAGEPLREGGVSPAAVVAAPGASLGTQVEWAGVVVGVVNRATSSQLEVLAYPPTRSGRPALGQPPSGRFLAIDEGYLEPLDFTPGRRVTVRGEVVEVAPGRVGGHELALPVVRMAGVTLWPRRPEVEGPRLRFHLGIGAGF